MKGSIGGLGGYAILGLLVSPIFLFPNTFSIWDTLFSNDCIYISLSSYAFKTSSNLALSWENLSSSWTDTTLPNFSISKAIPIIYLLPTSPALKIVNAPVCSVVEISYILVLSLFSIDQITRAWWSSLNLTPL